MIYKYDDIVKTTEETYSFPYVEAKDIGKAITIKVRDGNARGGYITKITDSEITCVPIVDIAKTFVKMPIVLDAKFLYYSDAVNICIYDPNTGQYDAYDMEVFVKRSKEKREFNTDILKPGARFFAENPHGTSIFEVLGCGRYILRIKECSLLEGIKIFSLIDDACNADELKSFTFKTIDELKPYDLCRRGFNGYKLSINAICKIKDILNEEEIIVDD